MAARTRGRSTARSARRTVRRIACLFLAVVASGWIAAPPAMARTFLTIDEALALAFPGCEVERSSIMLTEAQSLEIEALAGAKLRSTSVHPYRATCDGEPGGLALIDTHRVRTLPETLMIAIDADGQVRRVEILAFREPAEYIPPALWYAQFDGRSLDEALQVERGIRGVTGATLTARATTEAVRRALAIHAVLQAADGTASEASNSASGRGDGGR